MSAYESVNVPVSPMHVRGEKLQIGQNFEFVGLPYPYTPLIRGKFVIDLEKLSLHFLAKIHLDKCHIVSPLRDQKAAI